MDVSLKDSMHGVDDDHAADDHHDIIVARSLDELDRKEAHSVRVFWASLTGIMLLATLLVNALQGQTPDNSMAGTGYELEADELVDDTRPLLSQLIDEDEERTTIVGDVQWMLDFAIIGHSRTGTSTLANWLRSHESVAMHSEELHSLSQGDPADLVRRLYELPAGHYKRGYKSVGDIYHQSAISSLRDYWSKTGLIIGVRHPVEQFESLYNANSQQGKSLPPAETMVGRKFSDKPCFHEHLAMLGKTNVMNPSEADLLDWEMTEQPPPMPNRVFLYDAAQLFDHNQTRAAHFRKDLSDFLGLSVTLDPLIFRDRITEKCAIDICDARYDELRRELVSMGTSAAEWICTYFATDDSVVVSSPSYFEQLIGTWQRDPCEDADYRERRKYV